MELQRGGRSIGLFGALLCRVYDRTVMDRNPSLVHEHLDLDYLRIRAGAKKQSLQGVIVSADDLLAGDFPAYLVVTDTVSRHIYAHIGGRLVRALPIDLLEHRLKDREDLHIPVIIHGSLAICFQVEGIDHVDIVEICGGCLIGKIDRMLQRNIPDREGLELGIPCGDSPPVFLIEL